MAVAIAAASLAGQPAHAQPICPVSNRPVVELFMEVAPPDQLIATTLERHLTAELSARDIQVCPAPVGDRSVLARVHLRVDRPAAGPIVAIIEIGDEVTRKRIARTMNLTLVPISGRPLAVAAATDELLRASWAELSITDAPPMPMIAPPQVVRAVAESLRVTPARPDLEIGMLGSVSRLSQGRTAFGGGFGATLWLAPRIAAIARTSLAFAAPQSSAHGSITSTSLGGGAGAALSLTDRGSRGGVRAEGLIDLQRVSFIGTPDTGALGSSSSDFAIVASAGLRGWLTTGRVRWTVGGATLFPIRGTRATDSSQQVTAVDGFGAEVTLGVSILVDR